jgi:hypothetical protein
MAITPISVIKLFAVKSSINKLGHIRAADYHLQTQKYVAEGAPYQWKIKHHHLADSLA